MISCSPRGKSTLSCHVRHVPSPACPRWRRSVESRLAPAEGPVHRDLDTLYGTVRRTERVAGDPRLAGGHHATVLRLEDGAVQRDGSQRDAKTGVGLLRVGIRRRHAVGGRLEIVVGWSGAGGDTGEPLDAARADPAWHHDQAEATITGDGRITEEFFDRGRSRTLAWHLRPEAARLIEAIKDPNRCFDAIVIGSYERAFYGNRASLILPLLEQHGVALCCGCRRSADRSPPDTTNWSRCSGSRPSARSSVPGPAPWGRSHSPRPDQVQVHDHRHTGIPLCGKCARRMEGSWNNGAAAYRCRHGHSSASNSASRTLQAHVRESHLLARMPLLHHRLVLGRATTMTTVKAGTPVRAIPGRAVALKAVTPTPQEVIDELRRAAHTLTYHHPTKTLQVDGGKLPIRITV